LGGKVSHVGVDGPSDGFRGVVAGIVVSCTFNGECGEVIA